MTPNQGGSLSRLVNIQDIDQFFKIVEIPEEAITPAVVGSVRNLDEKRELEPMLREILFDPTETPHGPTEIADILTSKVGIGGRRCEAAFILKGKSYSKVRSTTIASQLIRLRQLPALDLIALVGVGHIQDDARRDVEQTATDAHCDFLVMDASDCARLLIAYEKICSKDGTPFGSDGVCLQGHRRAPRLELNVQISGDPEYEIAKLEDSSLALVRRLSAKILVNCNYSRDVLRQIIRRATREVANDSYHRYERLAARWGDSPGQVVWLFLAADSLDVRNCNWLARAQWIDPGLPSAWRPVKLDASEYLGDIAVIWEEGYASRRKYYREHTAAKGAFLGRLDPLVERARVAGEALCSSFELLEAGRIDERELMARVCRAAPEIEQVYVESANLPYAPEDAKDYDRRAHSLFAWLDNMRLYYSERGVEMWPESSRTYLMRLAVRDFRSDVARLTFEREKLH